MVGSRDRGRNTTTQVNTDISTNITRRDAAGSAAANMSGTARLASGLNLVVGLWLVIAPWVLGHAVIAAAKWNDVIVGVVVAVLAAIRLLMPLKVTFISWINMVLGVWLIISPFVLDYNIGGARGAGAPFWNDIIFGAAIVIFSVLSADSTNNTVAK